MKYALISDIHEDVLSLRSALRAIEREGCDEIICLGDILGFSPRYYPHGSTRNAQVCLDLVREHCSIVIPGNHDLHAIGKLPGHAGDFTFPENWYELEMGEREQRAANRVWLYNDGEEEPQISDDHIEWLRDLPDTRVFETSDGNVLLSHYAYPNLNGAMREFYNRKDEFHAHKAYMDRRDCGFSFFGHCHHEGLLVASRRLRSLAAGSSYRLKNGDCIAVPPVVDTGNASHLCIFNTEHLQARALQL